MKVMNKHYAVTDLHGMYNLWRQISDYCDNTDIIYYLGDAMDRGKDGFKIIDELLSDNRVCYIRGDHEEFFYTIGKEILNDTVNKTDILMWKQNGGWPTYKEFLNISDYWEEYYVNILSSLPIAVNYINKKGQYIFLSHAGTSPIAEIQSGDFLESQLLWDRDHCYDEWPDKYDNLYIVHGHTPADYLKQQLFSIGRISKWNPRHEILIYANGHKFDLDMASWQSERIALFDLDELKVERYFYNDIS